MRPFSLGETKDILTHAAVQMAMHRIIHTPDLYPPVTPPWPFEGRDNPTGPYRLLRSSVEKSIAYAMAHTTGTERERLLAVLRMVPGDDDVDGAVGKQVGIACENYAVTMHHGNAGLQSYRAFMEAYPL